MTISPSKPGFAHLIESLVIVFGRSPIVAVLGVGLLFSVFNAGAQLLGLSWQ
jgi:hypothetical protein